jgi:hypothetical protein
MPAYNMNQAIRAAPTNPHDACCIVDAALLVDWATRPVWVVVRFPLPLEGEAGGPVFPAPPFSLLAVGVMFSGANLARAAYAWMVSLPALGLRAKSVAGLVNKQLGIALTG